MAAKRGVVRSMDALKSRSKTLYFRDLSHPGSPVHVADHVSRDTAVSRPHDHDFYEFYLVREGMILQYQEGFKDSFSARTLVFCAPAMMHGFAGTGRITNVAFSAGYLNKALRFLGNREIEKTFQTGFVIRDVPIMLWERLTRMADSLKSGIPFSAKDTVCKAVLADMAAERALRECEKRENEMPGWLFQAMKQMAEGDNAKIGLARFIALSGKTQEHLTRTLKKASGITPTAFINRLRLKKVTGALIMTTGPVTAIAYEAGFNNLPYFNAVFKREFRMTPREYRKSLGREVVP
jgi:AraC family transcriptional regulator, dual regulator of chb operon